MENSRIATLLKETAQLLELHGANPFQVKHYSSAALCVEKTTQALANLSLGDLEKLPGLTPSSVKLVNELNTTGTLRRWEELHQATPNSLRELFSLRGIGPKKLRKIWQQLGIDNADDLLKACEKGEVAAVAGLGQKIQHAIQEGLAFKAQYAGMVHYSTASPYAEELTARLRQQFPHTLVSLAGPIRRKLEIIGQVDCLVGTEDIVAVIQWLDQQPQLQKVKQDSGPFAWRGVFVDSSLKVEIIFCTHQKFYQQLLLQTGAQAHLRLVVQEGKSIGERVHELSAPTSETAIYTHCALPYIPPELREGRIELPWALQKGAPTLLEAEDLKGVFHSHTTASDGKHTLAEMAQQCKALGYQYLGISDHSQSAAYAGGLRLPAIQQQHREIDILNQQYADFKIFKGIESDILTDGSLDYPDAVLATFDFVIASVHSGLQMDQAKATQRLIRAIENPYTTMLGHLTGRLLLRREGYPIDYRAVIDACAAHGVIIEINANPWRLELDWRWLDYALSKKVWISINPDAHNREGLKHMYYGVCVGRKGGLTAAQTFNALPLRGVEQYLAERKRRVTNRLEVAKG
ncbi:MAG: helix-hairpin-helix domain-containing protein [Bacteroidota bacterium]